MLPPNAALAAAQAGLGEDAAAVASIKRGIELRGARTEQSISAWYLFEVIDTLSTIASRDPSSHALRDGLESVAAFARDLAPYAAEGGDTVLIVVRHASVGASIDQLMRLASTVGVTIQPPAESFPGTDEALGVLDREHRPFDVARINLWRAEAGEPVPDLARATVLFEELGAPSYLERARRAAGGG